MRNPSLECGTEKISRVVEDQTCAGIGAVIGQSLKRIQDLFALCRGRKLKYSAAAAGAAIGAAASGSGSAIKVPSLVHDQTGGGKFSVEWSADEVVADSFFPLTV